jgi:peptide/nickel transport system permease protein
MRTFIFWRVVRAFFTVFVVLVAVFIGARFIGNPFEFMFPDGLTEEEERLFMEQYGLNKPLHIQFVLYVKELTRGNFGKSITEHRPVTEMYKEGLGETIRLAVCAFPLSICIGIPAGIIGALKRRSGLGRLSMVIAFLGYAVPHFIIAITLILIFSFHLHWLPSTGNASIWHYIMPTITLAAGLTASVSRYMRSTLLDVLSQDFLRTARAKGLTERSVIFVHALRNALIPVVTILGLQVTDLIAGSLIVETVFAWPGIGELLVGSVIDRDYPVLQFGVICFASVVVFVNLSVDILYAVIDPRIRTEA